MQTAHSILFYLHIVFGSAALLLFWVPVTAKKGQLNHKRFGNYYNKAMYVVSFTGLLISLMVLWDPILIHGERLSDPAKANIFIERMRTFYSLLLFLSILVFVGLRHGELTLKSKTSKAPLRSVSHLLTNALLVFAAPGLFYLGWQQNMTLPLVFSVLGLMLGLSNLRYCLSNAPIGKNWLKEHISAQIGTAIGAYIAFFAFGGRNLVENFGDWRLFFWLAPGVVGAIAIQHFTRKYTPASSTLKPRLKHGK